MKPLNRLLAGLALGSALALASPLAFASVDAISTAITDPDRPAEDRARDADRHPAELLAFSGVKAGDTVVDFLPGGGYFTRLFSDVIGDKGQVFAFVPKGAEGMHDMGKEAEAAVAGRANAKYANVPLLSPGFKDVDIFWTSQNYHDMHTKMGGGVEIGAFNKAIFDALKPGGAFIVIDHAAAAGADVAKTADDLHRIDPAVVKKEVEAAGFVFEEESKVLANPSDDHTKLVFDKSIRGKTDQFVYRFRKPK